MANRNKLSQSIDSLCESVDKAVAERDRLRARVQELEAALQPFVNAAHNAVASCAPDHPPGASQWSVEYNDLEVAYDAMCVAGKRVK